MGIEAWITSGVVFLIFGSLILNLAPADLLFLGGVAFVAVCGIITPDEAFEGFSNPGVLTVGVLFVIAAAMRETGILDLVGPRVLGRAKNERSALRRLAVTVIPMSAFLNNTPIVAMFAPMVVDWCRRNRVSPSKILIPLSFLAILGGTCTLIGTSTNIIINNEMLKPEHGLEGLHLFSLAKIGIPYAIVGFFYLYFLGPKLLPERKELLEQLKETRREYMAEMLVKPGCRLIGQTIEKAGLRHLETLFLMEIVRGEKIIERVSPDERIRENDRLVFTGVLSGIIELERIPQLVPAANSSYDVSPGSSFERRLCEAVISGSSPLIGQTIRDANFRGVFDAAVVAVHRGGERIKQKVGDIEIRSGDTLLLQVGPHFFRAHHNDPAFYLISTVDEWRPLRRSKTWVALGLFVALLIMMTAFSHIIPIAVAATFIAVLMVGFGCISAGVARRSVEYQILVTIASAFGIGAALKNSGVLDIITDGLFAVTQYGGPLAAMAVLYLLGSFLASIITNNVSAILLFDLCIKMAERFDVSPMPFLIALILAASASFSTPIGYQTNMIVYGPGGYKYSDFFKIGMPLTLLLWVVALIFVPIFWPF